MTEFETGSKTVEALIEIEHVNGVSHLGRSFCTYPMRFMQSANWKTIAEIYLLGFGGGIVSGDSIKISIVLKEGAVARFLTQGSTKIFKSLEDKISSQVLNVSLSPSSTLWWLPDPSVCFKDCRYKQKVNIEMPSTASLVFVDSFTCGRSNMGEFWNILLLSSQVQLKIDEKLVYLDNFELQDSDGYATVLDKVGHAGIFGSILLVGPNTALYRQRAQVLSGRDSWSTRKQSAVSPDKCDGSVNMAVHWQNREPVVSIMNITDEAVVVRFMCACAEDAYGIISAVLRPLNTEEYVPYANRLASAGGNIHYGRWNDHVLYQKFDEFDSVQKSK